jgi:hypothetical protein
MRLARLAGLLPEAGSAGRDNLANALLFQLTWFACVLGGAAGEPLWAAPWLALLAVQAFRGRSLRCDAVLVVLGVACGLVMDTAWIMLGVLDYAGAAIAPVWIVMLWAGVALTVNRSLSLFHRAPWLGGLLAGLCAPLSYVAGEKLGAVQISHGEGLIAIAVVWFFVFAGAFTFARRVPVSAENAP